jgi:hypothetical protein
MNQTQVKTHKRMNSNGYVSVGSSLVFGIGKTFKSGKLNIPINVFSTLPNQNGFRVGISIGYNSKSN